MESTVTGGIPEAPAPNLGLAQRAVAIFARPASAWVGLRERAQWWFPMSIVLIVTLATSALIHNRAIVPMMLETWDRQVAAGQMQPEQVDRMEQFFTSPAGLAVSVGQQAIAVPLLMLLVALVVWFAVGFLLGTSFRYRLALEVVCWAFLVTIPGALLTTALAWVKQTMRGVHVGFGVLLPVTDTPSRLQVALGVVLDALGPLSIWLLVVGILGAAALSGAPRKSVAWSLGTVYGVLILLLAALAALVTPMA